MQAAAYGRADVVRLLIAHHANLNERNRAHQKTALDFATYNGHQDIAQILREAGSRETP